MASAANAEVLFFDDFNTSSPDVDRNFWTTPEGNAAYFGRTAIRNPNIPENVMDSGWLRADNAVKVETSAFDNSIGVAKLRFDTYNPINGNDHTSFWGSEIDTGNGNNVNDFTTYSIQGRPVGEGISFEASIRPSPYLLNNPESALPGGIVTSVFAYGLKDELTGKRDEIDFEFLTKQDSNKVYLNYYTDEPTEGPGNPVEKILADFDTKEFNTVKINWFTDKIEWYVNDTIIHTVIASDEVSIPQGPMGLRINVWAPDETWGAAYDGAFLPVDNLGANDAFIYEVDWAKVSVTPEPVSCILFLIGGGTLAFFRKKVKI